MFCMFVKNHKKFLWLGEPVLAMPLYQASDAMPVDSDSDCIYFDHDILKDKAGALMNIPSSPFTKY